MQVGNLHRSNLDRLRRPSKESSRPEQAEKKVWLVHGSHTGGHAGAAKALQGALDRYDGVQVEVLNLAETSDSRVPASTAAEATLKAGALLGGLRRWVFDQQFEGHPLVKWVTDRVMAHEAKNQTAFLERVAQEKPDLIVSTMSATNSMLNALKADGKLEAPVHSVITDFAAHQVWAQDHIAHYYVATDSVKEDLTGFGVPEDKIQVAGIPIKGDFSTPPQDQAQARKALGLDPDKPTVLVLGGSLGLGDFSSTISSLDRASQNHQMVAITGRNEQLARDLENLPTWNPLTVKTFVTNMEDWIDAADLVVTKPGGMTASEILARGRTMLVREADSGLEARMQHGLVQAGAALSYGDQADLTEKVSQLLADQRARQTQAGKAQALGRPRSSEEIAAHIIGELG